MVAKFNHKRTPLFTGVKQHAKKKPIPFHIPGHKQGKGILPEFRKFLGDNVFSIDLINLPDLDDLHSPAGMIKEAQELAADAFGAERTFFSVQGTSTAIIAMIMATCSPGDKIILPRNVHKSILSALIITGARPIFMAPYLDKEWGIHHGVSPQAVKKIVDMHPDAKALLVINPTYYGVAGPLEEIVQIAHMRNIPVLVDEAHGSHFHFQPDLPPSAMEAGADIAASSIHKLGASMTQSSILNMKSDRISPAYVQKCLSLLTTTSTSYVLLASLDAARKQLKLTYPSKLKKTIQLANHAREEINKLTPLLCMGNEIIGEHDSACALDPLKLLIRVRDLGLTGHEAEAWLSKHVNIDVELSDLNNILCIITPADTKKQVKRLIAGLKKLVKEANHSKKHTPTSDIKLPPISKLAITPRKAFYAKKDTIPFELATDHVIAEPILIYPPGIPILLPGEIITEDHIDYLKEVKKKGIAIQGPEDILLQNVNVVKSDAILEVKKWN